MTNVPPLPFKVKAITPYTSINETEISISVGEIYTVDQTDNGKNIWWRAKDTKGNLGWFPSRYTQIIKDDRQENQQSPNPVTLNLDSPKQSEPHKTESLPLNSLTVQETEKKKNNQNNETQINQKTEAPQPSRLPRVEKGKAPYYVWIQIVEGKNLKAVDGLETKTNPSAHIYRRESENERGEKIFSSSRFCKKTLNPQWNEKFLINVYDAEKDNIVIRFSSGTRPSLKGKFYLGEILFPLRKDVRDYDYPNYQFKFYPITGKSDKGPGPTGEVKIFIQYVDARVVAKPGSNPWTDDDEFANDEEDFNILNIPPEWKQVLKDAGIRRRDLENIPELKREVLKILCEAQDYATKKGFSLIDIMHLEEPLLTIIIDVKTPPPPPLPPSKTGMESNVITPSPPISKPGGQLVQSGNLIQTLQKIYENHIKDISFSNLHDDWSIDEWLDED